MELGMERRLELLSAVICEFQIGVVALDSQERIVLWNRWMEEGSGIFKSQAEGERFTDLLPEMAGGRVHGAVRLALEKGCSTLLSQSLNKAPFPLYAQGPQGRERLQQQVHVTPLNLDGSAARYALIQVFDVSAAVGRERLLRDQALELRQFSLMDGLTGIGNRRRFDEFFDTEFRRAVRSGDPLSLIMLDIDYFKSYNDNFGHQAGDRCLIQVAGAITGALCRPGDLAARYGGEEFAVVLPETGEEGAAHMAESIRRRVEALNIAHPASAVAERVTVSLGVATARPTAHDIPNRIIAEADTALYEAKNAGRNRVARATR
jgi:diguanylate cyclase (GGDEF)-like protein